MRKTAPYWVSGFLDLPADAHEAGSRFWENVTGWRRSAPRGDFGEFSTLEPPAGDATLRVQRVFDGVSRMHVDLHVPDVREAARQSLDAGARLLADHASDGYIVTRTPGGLAVCFVDNPGAVPPPPTEWSPTLQSIPDQLCIDIPAHLHDQETAYWSTVTSRPLTEVPHHPEFLRLPAPGPRGLHLLLHRTNSPGQVQAHLDFATTNLPAETTRHLHQGATLLQTHPSWTTLLAPTGTPYCLTTRHP
ncbi:VOC family protein [Actinocorallia sp. A-T 12471]|uniref:VOC family protein n=1 Tax=Actinocorallia sp. A-T 12471 TaxID=3089813 RepID=UPI0029D03A02|nr:VOC family protein [Actinocorallia sp. A-T 12471]MDX6742984.1 VOC family protein [Actinocorallia sp. A-T 12471]